MSTAGKQLRTSPLRGRSPDPIDMNVYKLLLLAGAIYDTNHKTMASVQLYENKSNKKACLTLASAEAPAFLASQSQRRPRLTNRPLKQKSIHETSVCVHISFAERATRAALHEMW